MESAFPLELFRSNLLLVGVLVAFILSWIVLSGLWMKLANQLCGGAPVGMLRATLAVVVSGVLGGMASLLAIVVQPDNPSYISCIYATGGSVAGISMVLSQNPLRAFLTHIVCSLLQGISGIGFAVAFMMLVFTTIPAERMWKIDSDLSEGSNQTKSAPVENAFLKSAGQVKSRDELDSLMYGPPIKNVKASSEARASYVAPVQEVHLPSGNPPKAMPLEPGMQANPFAQ
jgi:hypothetical protein